MMPIIHYLNYFFMASDLFQEKEVCSQSANQKKTSDMPTFITKLTITASPLRNCSSQKILPVGRRRTKALQKFATLPYTLISHKHHSKLFTQLK
jgi:hypothetical protein